MADIHLGGCQCGALRYQFEAPLQDIAHCHCSICRRSTGGIVTTWITVPLASFHWLAGTPREYTSSSSCMRSFCPTCGAHLTLFTAHSPDSLDITIAPSTNLNWRRRIDISGCKAVCPGCTLDPQLPEEDQEIMD